VKKVGIIGAGMMGAGIAYVSANAGIEVVLIDAAQEAADKGKAYSEGLLDKGMKRGKVTEEKKARGSGPDHRHHRLRRTRGLRPDRRGGVRGPQGEGRGDEERARRRRPGHDLRHQHLHPADHRSGEGLDKPEQFIGIHFFSPVDKMALVEIIKGRETGDRAVAKALDYVRQIRKTPIVVNDARFFYANRCILPYVNEGVRLLKEGVAPR
jgi:3-hydroxyacyl-CoA dehydrogenase/enoyl-CoA hydratase/3-hydroxybutyryl-CoA epimerase